MTAAERRMLTRQWQDGRDAVIRELGRLLALDPETCGERTPRRRATMARGAVARVAQPKPRRRLIDRAARDRYMAAHPLCERCLTFPATECHHIRARWMFGADDVPENFLALDHWCHAAWKQDTRKDKGQWLAWAFPRLPSPARLRLNGKVTAALAGPWWREAQQRKEHHA